MPNAETPAATANVISSADVLLSCLARRGCYIAASEGRWLLADAARDAAAPRPRVALNAIDELRRKGRLVPRPGGGMQLPPSQAPAPPASGRRPPAPPAGGGPESAGPIFNDAESPLAWLRARKGRNGHALISGEQFLAGEKLRADYERAAMAARVTANWDMPASRGRGGAAPLTVTDAALAARRRYHAALAAVGEELSSILVQVCCLAAGIENAERILDLPQRSGRAVLGLALTALARHYGLIASRRAAGATGHWARPGYRPEIAPSTDE